MSSKGFKRYTQGYTVNKLAKESNNKIDSYVKVINKAKSKPKRPSSSKKRKATPNEKRGTSTSGNATNKPLIGISIGLYNGNFGDRNSCFVNQNTLSLNIGGGTFNQDNSTMSKDTFLSKTIGDNLHNKMSTMKPKPMN